VEVSIKKVGERDGVERFILVNSQTRRVISANDVDEAAIRRFFAQLGADGELIDACIERASERFNEPGEDDLTGDDEDDLLFELGLDEGE
jgi:hypothetical protein